jgi:predicted GNAT family acetyltransferase
MRFVLTRDPRQFEEHARAFLTDRIERNVLMTTLMNVLSGRFAGEAPLFAYGLGDGDELRFAAMRVAPYPMLTSELDPVHAGELVELWLRQDPELPGVSGPTGTARAIAAAWSGHTGRRARCRRREALHALERLREPTRPAPGHLRLPRPDEHELLGDWAVEFTREAGVIGGDEHARASSRSQVYRGTLRVWDNGEPVSMVGTAQRVTDVLRSAPVSPPPVGGRRGYATSAVAAVCREALAAGVQRCALFTDLANPTSNKIYAEIGFRPVTDWEEQALGS